MSIRTNSLLGSLMTALVVAACGGGDGDGGNGPGGGGPSAGERTAMVAALNAAAANAEAAGDGAGVIILQGAAAMLQSDLTVTSVTGVSFVREAGVVQTSRLVSVAGGWAFGVELGLTQGQSPQIEVGAYEGAVVISGGNIAYGFGLKSATPGFVGSSFGAIWQGANAGWSATALTGFGVADSIIGGNCLNSTPAGLGIIDCTHASLSGPGFSITASTPINFPGNTATGSKTMAFGPSRLRGAVVIVDCNQSTYC